MMVQTETTVAAARGARWQVLRVRMLLLVSGALSACMAKEASPEATPATDSFAVVLAVRAAANAPVRDARVFANKKLLGTTDGSGLSRLSLKGRDGQTVPLTIECPAGFSSPQAPVPVALRRLTPGSRPPRFEAHCLSTTHSVLIGIRAERGANLPILQLGRSIGSTDASGNAHVLLANVTADQPIALTLDTSQQPLLRPQNPVLTFVPAARDELVLLEQTFSRAEPKRKPKAPRPLGPQRL